jgi:hypothetical protein
METYVNGKLEQFRDNFAQAIVEDLLQCALELSLGDGIRKIDAGNAQEVSSVVDDKYSHSDAAAQATADGIVCHPHAMKSFSFI